MLCSHDCRRAPCSAVGMTLEYPHFGQPGTISKEPSAHSNQEGNRNRRLWSQCRCATLRLVVTLFRVARAGASLRYAWSSLRAFDNSPSNPGPKLIAELGVGSF